MQKLEKIAQELSEKISQEVVSKEISQEMLKQVDKLVKEVVKSEFRLKRTLRDKEISNAVLKNTISKLEKQNEVIEKQSRFKEELFASISHELRTPLHGILGMSQLISRTEMSEKQANFVNVIKGSADNLLVIINDILSLTQMNAGKVEIVERPFYLPDFIKEIEGVLKLQAEEKNLFLRFEVASNTPKNILGDYTRLYQILINLLNNSIKFTEKGWILLKVESLENRTDESDLLFTVEDTGIGIEKEKQEQIFEPFSRVHDLEGGVIEGAGLGLNIVKKLMSLLGGEISVESEYGKGTCFKLYLTCKTLDEEVSETSEPNLDEIEIPAKWKDLNFLFIEDNPTNILYAKHLFEEWNIEIDVAEDCTISRKKLKDTKYDCILSDVKLPDGNGIDLIREIRENFNSPNYQTPVIILTASASEHERIITEAINIQSYMGKPFLPTHLIKEMKMAIDNHHKDSTKPSFAVPKSPEPAEKSEYFASLHKNFGKNLSVVKEMLEIFKIQIPVTLGKLDKNLEEENHEGFYFEIHRIKSTINIVGLPKLLELAMVLERDSYEAADVSRIPEFFGKFKVQVEKDLQIIDAELERISEKVS